MFSRQQSAPLGDRMGSIMPRIFLSHSSKDRQLADDLAELFRLHYVETWYSQRDILAGPWEPEIDKGLDLCDSFLVVLSDDCACAPSGCARKSNSPCKTPATSSAAESSLSWPGRAIGKRLAPIFHPLAELARDLGGYRSPLQFDDGTLVKVRADWVKRRQEILKTWHDLMGPWPDLIAKPKIEYLEKETHPGFTQHHVRIEVAPKQTCDSAYLLVPEGKGPFPAVLVVFYEGKTGIGMGKAELDFALQLAKRGFVALSIGGLGHYYPDKAKAQLQPLSFLAYQAGNCHTLLANLPQVDPRRIGIVGHSYGGKWAMFASCLYDKFACAAWSDGGIVFDEKRANVNYWEPWYLGHEKDRERKPGVPNKDNPRTGPYKKMIETGHDLHELHALMAPRPFLVSGGSEDRPERWKALIHAIAVNKLLGYKERVAMTNRR